MTHSLTSPCSKKNNSPGSSHLVSETAPAAPARWWYPQIHSSPGWGDEVWTLGINRLTFFGGMKSPTNYSMVRIKGWNCLNPPTSHGWNIKWWDDGSWWLMVKQASTGLLPLVSVHHALNGMQHQRHVAEEIEFSWWSQPQGYQRIIPTPHHCMACLKMGENQNWGCHN